MYKYFYCCLIVFSCLFFRSNGQEQTVGLFLNDSLAYNGYTMYTAPNFTSYLFDNCGFVVHSWEANVPAGLSSYLLEDGHLLRTGIINGPFNGAGAGGRIEKFSWEGDLVWSYDFISADYRQHHDIEPMPNGNILVIAWELRTEAQAVEAGAQADLVYWPLMIAELMPIGSNETEIVWEWHLWDHLVQDVDSTKANYGVVSAHPELVDINFSPPGGGGGPGGNNGDWVHANSIDYHAERDEILLSVRSFDEIWIIDHSTTTEEAAGHTGGNSGKGGDILYRWGNPRAYGRGNQFDQMFFGQHDAKWIPEGYPDEGKIMVFNNGSGRPEGTFSTINIIEIPLDSLGNYILEGDLAYGPQDYFWEYQADPPESLFSQNQGGVQNLPNGNSLICVTNEGRFLEVTMDGEVVWEYINPVGFSGPVSQGNNVPGNSGAFRITRYDAAYPAFVGRDLTPGDPIELNPLPTDCVIYENTISAVPKIDHSQAIQIFPNPSYGHWTINNNLDEPLILSIIRVDGSKMLDLEINDAYYEINGNNWPPGIYFAQIKSQQNQLLSTEKLLKI